MQLQPRNKDANKNKFVGVRQRPSGKWVAEIKNTSTQKIRMWLGTFDTAEKAAMAYKEAACLLRGSNTRTNFLNNLPFNPSLSLRIRNLFNQKRGLNKATPPALASSATPRCANQETRSKNVSPSCSFQYSTGCSFSRNFEDAYRPDLSYFNGGYEEGSSHINYCDQASTYAVDFDRISLQEDGLYVTKLAQLQDYTWTKVKPQMSASLYAMNGITEYWDPLWEIPSLCQMFCPS